jgi:thiol-disulfide isomerase/thioredoxin
MGRSNRLLRVMLTLFLVAAVSSAFAAGAAVNGADKAAPWYSDGLKALGFTVFPEPKDVGDFTASALSGPAVKLSSLRGKIVILNFWATWCPPCRAEMPALEALWKASKDKAFTIMGVSVGEKSQTVKDFIAEAGYSYPIFVDSGNALGSRFGARSIPTTYIFDKNGKAIAGKVGGAPYDSAQSIELFSELAAR